MAVERSQPVRGRAGDPWRPKEQASWLLATILWSVARLRGPIRAFGLDYELFRELLAVRVLLTQRATSSSSKAWGSAGATIAILMTWFFGLGTGLTALLTGNGGVWVVTSLSALMLLLAVLLFQVLTSILVDPTDIGVVAPHPISDRTVFAARLAEVSAYVLVFVVSFTAGSVLLAVFALPPLAVLFVYPFLALLAGATTLGLVALLFAVCLRVVGPTHFQRVTLWVQILGGVSIFGGFHLTRMVHREQWGLWFDEYEGLRFLLPPFQYAELFVFASGAEAGFPLREGLAAVLAPVAALGVTFWLASRYFVAGLQGTLGAPTPRSGWEHGLLSRIGARLSRREERAGFGFALALSRREPHLLRAVLPQLMMFQAMVLGAGFGLRRDLQYFLPASAGFLFMVLPNLLLQAQSTPVPEARELFVAAPLESEDVFLRGGTKALLLQWVGMPTLVLFLIQLWAAGPGALARIVLAIELSIAATLLFTRLFHLSLFFTRPIRVGETGAANFGLILLMGFGMGGVVLLHILLTLHPIALWSGIALTSVLLILLWRRLEGLRVASDRRLLTLRTRLVVD